MSLFREKEPSKAEKKQHVRDKPEIDGKCYISVFFFFSSWVKKLQFKQNIVESIAVHLNSMVGKCKKKKRKKKRSIGVWKVIDYRKGRDQNGKMATTGISGMNFRWLA